MARGYLKSDELRIGLISDTHGLIRPEAIEALAGVDMVIHAGDMGKFEVIRGLRSIASVVAVRGNIDHSSWAHSIPETTTVRLGQASIFVIHNVKQMKFNPLTANLNVVISGHSHRPCILKRGGVLFVNPGSAGPRRFKLPVAVGILHLKGSTTRGEIVVLNV